MKHSSSVVTVLAGLLVAFATGGCGSKESSIVGVWKIDGEATKASIRDDLKAKNVPQNLIDIQMQTISASAEAMTFDFKSDKTCEAMGTPATWQFDGNNVTVSNTAGAAMRLEYKSGKLYFAPKPNSGAIVLARQ